MTRYTATTPSGRTVRLSTPPSATVHRCLDVQEDNQLAFWTGLRNVLPLAVAFWAGLFWWLA